MMNLMPIRVVKLPHFAGLTLPAYATEGAAGMDLLAAVSKPVDLQPGGRVLIPTGLQVALPPGYELQVRPRSGLALKNGIVVANSPGTVDEDFRGELGVILMNADPWDVFTIVRGMRVAQAVLAPVVRASWQVVETLPPTARGAGGFGSSGLGVQPTTDLKGWQ